MAHDHELWLAMQLADTSFPGGTLGHSQGVESALYFHLIQLKQGSSPATFQRYVQLSLQQVSSCIFSLSFLILYLGKIFCYPFPSHSLVNSGRYHSIAITTVAKPYQPGPILSRKY